MSSLAAVKTIPSSSSSTGSGPLVAGVVAETSFSLVGRLMESLLHDARNPLNALAINLEVLSEKLKTETGEVPASQEKNLKAMREQVFRVDAILKLFAEFIAPHTGGADATLGEVVQHAVDVLGHECRLRRLKVVAELEGNLKIRSRPTPDLQLLVLHAMMLSMLRAPPGCELRVSAQKRDGRPVLAIRDSAGAGVEPSPELISALDLLAREHDAELRISAAECAVFFPAAQSTSPLTVPTSS